MRDPEVAVVLRGAADKPTLTVVSRGSTNVLHTVQWKLEDVEKEGYFGVCEKLGNAVMALLAQEYPEVFEKYPLLKPPVSFVADPVHMVMELMGLCIKFKTKVYVPAIDDFFNRYPEDLAKTNLPDTWLTMKEEFLKFQG